MIIIYESARKASASSLSGMHTHTEIYTQCVLHTDLKCRLDIVCGGNSHGNWFKYAESVLLILIWNLLIICKMCEDAIYYSL